MRTFWSVGCCMEGRRGGVMGREEGGCGGGEGTFIMGMEALIRALVILEKG